MCKSFEIQIYVDWFLSHIVASRRESTKDKRQSESNHIIYLIITGNISLQLSANAGPSLMKIIHLSLPRPNNTNSTS